MQKWRAMDSAIDATRYGLDQRGRTKRDSFSLCELQAFSISTTGKRRSGQHGLRR